MECLTEENAGLLICCEGTLGLVKIKVLSLSKTVVFEQDFVVSVPKYLYLPPFIFFTFPASIIPFLAW